MSKWSHSVGHICNKSCYLKTRAANSEACRARQAVPVRRVAEGKNANYTRPWPGFNFPSFDASMKVSAKMGTAVTRGLWPWPRCGHRTDDRLRPWGQPVLSSPDQDLVGVWVWGSQSFCC